MFDFGDDLTVETGRIPWLIWIQLLVTFLLILLLYSLSLFTFDPSNPKGNLCCTTSSTSSTHRFVSQNLTPLPRRQTSIVVSSTSAHTTQVGEGQNVKGDIATSTCGRIVGGGEDMLERESPWPIHAYFHPCNYFRLARIAFLKCLGLESTSENLTPDQNRRKQQRKRKES